MIDQDFVRKSVSPRLLIGGLKFYGQGGLADVGTDAPLFQASNGQSRRITERPEKTEPSSVLVRRRIIWA
jgi:hypothetical protein